LTGIAPDAAALLTEGRWSGNIRELQNCIEKAVILSEAKNLTGRIDGEASLPMVPQDDLAAWLTCRECVGSATRATLRTMGFSRIVI